MDDNRSGRLLDVAQAARKLHVSEETIRRRISSGELEAFRIAPFNHVRILERSVDELLVPYRKGQA